MFKKLLLSLGVGGASVETTLDSSEVEPGGTLSGQVRIEGGDVEQEIRGITLEIVTRCRVETSGDEKIYAEISLGEAHLNGLRVAAKGKTSIPFQIRLPESCPLTVGSTSTVLKTSLDIPGAIDPTDTDTIRVVPNRVQDAILQGVMNAGFRLAETEVEYNARRQNPFVQEFDFKPTSSRDWGVEEVEISFSPVQNGVQVALTVDRRGGFFQAGGERTKRFSVRESDLGRVDIRVELRQAINALAR